MRPTRWLREDEYASNQRRFVHDVCTSILRTSRQLGESLRELSHVYPPTMEISVVHLRCDSADKMPRIVGQPQLNLLKRGKFRLRLY